MEFIIKKTENTRDNPKSLLKSFFGFNDFRSGQEEIINSIITGKNILAVLPTGGGKSICYQIPALLANSFSLVISPLISLMKDQTDNLNQISPVAAFINSSVDCSQRTEIFTGIFQGKIKILYVSPEKLEDREFANLVKNLKPSYLFIDEAHCISQWGHNFRPAYRNISDFIKYTGIKNIAAFTATATPEVRTDILKFLDIPNAELFVKGFHRDNLTLSVINSSDQKSTVADLLKKNLLPAIIYASTRKSADDLSRFLKLRGFDNAPYHAGMTIELRKEIQERFISGDFNIIVATSAFGMGVDKSDIRAVIHSNMPSSIEAYYQEIGRAGRDGAPATAVLIFSKKDVSTHEFLIKISHPQRDEIKFIYDTLCSYHGIGIGGIKNKFLHVDEKISAYFGSKGVEPRLIPSALKALEQAGCIKMESALNMKTSFKFLLETNMLKEYIRSLPANTTKEILVLLLREFGAAPFSQNTQFSFDNLSKLTGLSIDSMKDIFTKLAGIGILDYDAGEGKMRFKLTYPRIESSSLNINQDLLDIETNSARIKLGKMIDFAHTQDCRFSFILNYFGDPDSVNFKCNKCDNCNNGGINKSNEFLIERIIDVCSENKNITSNDIVNILKGSCNDPRLIADHSFGSTAHYTSDEILIALDSAVIKNLIVINNGSYSLNIETVLFGKEGENDEEFPRLQETNTSFVMNKLIEARKNIAAKFLQKPEMICSDEVLKAIASQMPENENELFRIEGYTRKTHSKFGDEVLFTIKQNTKPEIPDGLKFLRDLLDRGNNFDQILKITGLSDILIAAQLIELEKFTKTPDVIKLLGKINYEKLKKSYNDGNTELLQLRNSLPANISQGMIMLFLNKTLTD